jgi:hypothetical protein
MPAMPRTPTCGKSSYDAHPRPCNQSSGRNSSASSRYPGSTTNFTARHANRSITSGNGATAVRLSATRRPQALLTEASAIDPLHLLLVRPDEPPDA